ncbi:MAG: pirin family protein [Verrucomicrobiota bacterium]
MIKVRKSEERGHVKLDWLDSRHTFSFGEYYDPQHMAFRALRVINEDYVAGGTGFGAHPHRDMEIVTYVLDGVLEHKDNMGNGSLIHPGEVQRMSAGSGIVHSEFNHSKTDKVHLLQIWLMPERKGIAPGYEQKTISIEQKHNQLCVLASLGSRDGSVKIHQDVELFTSVLDEGREITHSLAKGRGAWLQVASGSVNLNGISLNTGDAAAVEQEQMLRIQGTNKGEFLLFDLG